MKKFLLPLMVLGMFSCTPDPGDDPPGSPYFDGTAYRPVYQTEAEVSRIVTESAKPLTDPGKIYLRKPYLFVNERGKGIHIIDNSDPRNPNNISFISIPSNYDIAVKDNWLYADNASDLVVFDISDPSQPKLTKRVDDAIPVINYPPVTGVFFECIDAKRGVIVGWEKIDMEKRPNCYR